MKFFLFSQSSFEVDDPLALIESYCFQSDFYVNYDLLLYKGNRSIEDVNKIGARIKDDCLSDCKEIIAQYENIPILKYNLGKFLEEDPETRELHITDLSRLVKELDGIKGIGLSKATKILHS